MATASDDRPLGFLLTDTEIEEFRVLAREHAGAELTPDEAYSVAGQLLRILAIVRDAVVRSSNGSDSSVDGRPLPDSGIRAITTFPPK